MLKSFLDIFRNFYYCTLIAITCTIICLVGKYRSFGFIKLGEFELSFDFLFFAALVFASVSWIILLLGAGGYILYYLYGRILLYRLKRCNLQEKDFLYNRVFSNGNELQIDMNSDPYFYQQSNFTYLPYREGLQTKEEIIRLLRSLENKKIIKNFGNQSMIIHQQVWNILVKNSEKIFKGLEK